MFKTALAASLIGLFAACSANPTYSSSTRSMGSSSDTAAMGAARSPGEGPSFNPVYGGAGF